MDYNTTFRNIVKAMFISHAFFHSAHNIYFSKFNAIVSLARSLRIPREHNN